jgi:hypothetical protein
MKKITYQQYESFVKDFRAGKYPHQRFGQAFENVFEVCEGGVIITPVVGGPWIERINDKCVWNDSEAAANKIIFEHYIDWASTGGYPMVTPEELEKLRSAEHIDDGDYGY